jgi:hypothetical protein
MRYGEYFAAQVPPMGTVGEIAERAAQHAALQPASAGSGAASGACPRSCCSRSGASPKHPLRRVHVVLVGHVLGQRPVQDAVPHHHAVSGVGAGGEFLSFEAAVPEQPLEEPQSQAVDLKDGPGRVVVALRPVPDVHLQRGRLARPGSLSGQGDQGPDRLRRVRRGIGQPRDDFEGRSLTPVLQQPPQQVRERAEVPVEAALRHAEPLAERGDLDSANVLLSKDVRPGGDPVTLRERRLGRAASAAAMWLVRVGHARP